MEPLKSSNGFMSQWVNLFRDAARKSSAWCMPMKSKKNWNLLGQRSLQTRSLVFMVPGGPEKQDCSKPRAEFNSNVPNAITLLPVFVPSYCIMGSGSAAHLGVGKNWKIRLSEYIEWETEKQKKFYKRVADVRLNFIIKMERDVRSKHLPKIMLEIDFHPLPSFVCRSRL